MYSKKYKIKKKPTSINSKPKKPNDYSQIKNIKYTNLKIQESNVIHNTKTNKPHHKNFKLILNPTHKILIKKTNTIPNNTPIKTRTSNIQTKTNTKITTKHAKNDNHTNTTIRKNTKYHQKKTLYSPGMAGLLTPLTNNKRGSAKTKTKYVLTNN